MILSEDDIMAEKTGERFECCSVLFDHAAHNGSSYLNGHCFVSSVIFLRKCKIFVGKVHLPDYFIFKTLENYGYCVELL